LAGVSNNSLADVKIYYYSLLLQLLKIGIPYEAIQEMSQTEILYILTVNMVQEERQNQNG
jgi:hypothetical protein|tara:strand:+ start:850 stop:1029 length:180 start_codon:yes stop_codon:yes gene_type:complete